MRFACLDHWTFHACIEDKYLSFLQVWFKNRRAKCRQQQSAATKQPPPHTAEEESPKNNGSIKRPKLVKTSQHSDSSGNNPSESPSSSSTVNSYPSPSNISSSANMDSYISTPTTLDNFWSTSGGVNSMPVLSPSTDNGLRQSSLSLQVKASNLSPSHRSTTDNTNTGIPAYNTNTYYSAAHVPPPPPPPPPAPPTVPVAASGMDLSYFGHHSTHYNSYINHHHGSTAAGMLRSASADYDYNIVASTAGVDRYQQL